MPPKKKTVSRKRRRPTPEAAPEPGSAPEATPGSTSENAVQRRGNSVTPSIDDPGGASGHRPTTADLKRKGSKHEFSKSPEPKDNSRRTAGISASTHLNEPAPSVLATDSLTSDSLGERSEETNHHIYCHKNQHTKSPASVRAMDPTNNQADNRISDPTNDRISDQISDDVLLEAKPQVLSVSELNGHIREVLEGRFPLLWIKGEISNFKAHTSGHFYFSLKDSKAQINAVMFRGFNSHLRFRPEDGMEVLVRGKVTVYEPRGNYQIFCELMEPVGAGALQKAFEQLKAKLRKEGLFDAAKKRPLPTLPKHIAIVTSPTGAAIRDMLNVLSRRFRGAAVTLIPCKVQGNQAPAEIVAAIGLANRLRDIDVMIVGRGGGSIEDLWAFNDERVARAIAGARVPVISAVGHEVDFTIADFVADLRAPTPSAAAELVVKNASDLLERVTALRRALMLAMSRRLKSSAQELIGLSRRLVDPQRRIQDAVMRCDELMQRLEGALTRSFQRMRLQAQYESRLKTTMRHLLSSHHQSLAKAAAVLDSLSPLKVLDRGYSMVTVGGKIITNAEDLKIGQRVTVRMCRGQMDAEVKEIKEHRDKKE